MKKEAKKANRVWLRAAAVLLSLLVMLLWTVLNGALAVRWLTGDSALAARAQAEVLPLQVARVHRAVDAAAAEYGFSAEAVKAVLSREKVAADAAAATGWWLGLFRGETEQIWFSTADAEAVILEDEAYCERVSVYEQRMLARDVIGPGIERELSAAVMPLRMDLAGAAFREAGKRFDLSRLPGLLNRYGLALPAAGLVLCLLLLLLTGRGERGEGLRLTGCAMIAAGLQLLLVIGLAALLNLPGRAAVMSEICAAQLTAVLRLLLVRALALNLAMLLPGAGLLLAARRQSEAKA